MNVSTEPSGHLFDPALDDRDVALRDAREQTWNECRGPRVGDWIRMPGGSMRRFTYAWPDGIQTTWEDHDGSFYFGENGASYSGSLDRTIPYDKLVQTDERRWGRFWFFHHNWAQAHNGVHFSIACRVFEVRS